MMPDNFIKEQLSLAYIQAVTARVGYELDIKRVDYRGIDGVIENPALSGVNRVDFQLKSSADFVIRETEIAYDLRIQNYNSLVQEKDIPRVFILFIMPKDDAEWLIQNPDELCLRKCAYWLSLMGEAASANASAKRVHIPKANIFDTHGLTDMFAQLGLTR